MIRYNTSGCHKPLLMVRSRPGPTRVAPPAAPTPLPSRSKRSRMAGRQAPAKVRALTTSEVTRVGT